MLIKKKINHTINTINLYVSFIVLFTGLILFTKFHIGEGEFRKKLIGIDKYIWLIIHQISGIAFLVGFIVHILLHKKYIVKIIEQWKVRLKYKTKLKTLFQIMLLFSTLIVLYTGFFPWITMPGSTLSNKSYHTLIDIHNRVGFAFTLGIIIHILKRWRRIFVLQ